MLIDMSIKKFQPVCHMFPDDIKPLHIGRPADQVQSNLDALEDWVTRNKKVLAIEKCAKVLFKGPESQFYLCGSLLQTSAGVKDLEFGYNPI